MFQIPFSGVAYRDEMKSTLETWKQHQIIRTTEHAAVLESMKRRELPNRSKFDHSGTPNQEEKTCKVHDIYIYDSQYKSSIQESAFMENHLHEEALLQT